MVHIGRLVVGSEGKLVVVHNIDGWEVNVPTLRGQLGKKVLVDVDGKAVEVDSACVWEFHGKPCQERSSRFGGEGYQRRRL